MTEHERDIYMLLCLTGRSREAMDYRAECEARKQADGGIQAEDAAEEETTAHHSNRRAHYDKD